MFRLLTEEVMIMIKLNRVIPCAALLLASSFVAQAGTASFAFTTVTGIHYGTNGATLMGALTGATAPTIVSIPVLPDENCARFLETMISTPGTYLLTIVQDTEIDGATGLPSTSISSCGLDRSRSYPAR
jgi:hypothetical protein